MKYILLSIFLFKANLRIFSSDNSFFSKGVEMINISTGYDMHGQKIVGTSRYTISGDTCITGRKIYKLKIEDYLADFNIWYLNRISGLEYDSIQNKIFYYPFLGSLFRKELYDFNIQIDSINIWGFRLDSIRPVNFENTTKNLYFFTDVNETESWRKYDIWLEGYGSIGIDYISPQYPANIDWYSYNYNQRINFNNQVQIKKKEYQLQPKVFQKINLMDEKTLPRFSISKSCSGTIDTSYFYDKCFDDSVYRFTLDPSVNNSKNYTCLDTIFYQIKINGLQANKLISWSLKTDKYIIQYPTNYFQIPNPITNTVTVMNTDSSCIQTYRYDSILYNCTYCDDPKNNPNLTLSFNKDTMKCNEKLICNISSNGQSDSLWFYTLKTIDYTSKTTQTLIFHFGNRYCIRDSIAKNFFVDCYDSKINNGINSLLDLYYYDESQYIELISSKDDRLITSIYNILGQKVLDTDSRKFNISYLTKGVYFLEIRDKNNQLLKNKKLLIRHSYD